MQLITSASPHIRKPRATRGVMLDVLIALLPTVVASIIIFGLNAALLITTCVISCVLFELLFTLITKRPHTISDLSAAVTGVLLAFCLPSTLPLWMAVIGSFCAIILTKALFGGLGKNFANPAITARVILTLSFGKAMTDFSTHVTATHNAGASIVAGATPLAGAHTSLLNLLFGNHGGSLGETFIVGLVIGGAYLVLRQVIKPTIPVLYIGSVALLTLICGGDSVTATLSGGLVLGAIFMATDPVTCPTSTPAQVVYALLLGILTWLFRTFSNMHEGVSFAILFSNCLVPYLDRFIYFRPIGSKKCP